MASGMKSPSAEGIFAGRVVGTSMWPALRAGDLLVVRDLPEPEKAKPGQILVAELRGRLIVHRFLARRPDGTRAFQLAGDLSGLDSPVEPSAIRGVVAAVFRPGRGFVELRQPLPLGTFGRRLVGGLARALARARAHARDRRQASKSR